MKRIYLLALSINFFICNTHGMNAKISKLSLRKHTSNSKISPRTELNFKYVKTNDKKIIPLTLQDASHSSYISIQNHDKPSSKKSPILINASKKEIALFQEMLHKPALYGNCNLFSEEKFYNTLTAAIKICSPVLYAELLQARLPPKAIELITQNYVALLNIEYNIWQTIYIKQKRFHEAQLQIAANEKAKNKLINNNRILMEKLLEKWHEIKKTITLPQALLLTIIAKDQFSDNYYFMYITPHMSGYNAFITWEKAQHKEFIFSKLPISAIEAINNPEKVDDLLYIYFKV